MNHECGVEQDFDFIWRQDRWSMRRRTASSVCSSSKPMVEEHFTNR